MRHRIFFALVTVFFVTMNVLLWRSEFGGHGGISSEVPVAVVWQKILTAPDNSKLGIEAGGVRMGYCVWSPSVGEERATGRQMSEDVPPEGMVKTLSGYNLELEARLTRGDYRGLKITLDLQLDTNHVWQNLACRFNIRPTEWSVRASAAEQKVHIEVNDDEGRMERTLKFSDLQNPEKLLREFGGPFAPETLRMFGVPLGASQTSPLPPGLKWEAHNDHLKLGHTRVPVYRLEARLMERFSAVFYVNPVGEVLRVELPNNLVLLNEALTGF